MAIMKKEFFKNKKSDSNTGFGSEIVQVISYDEGANEIRAIRLNTGEEVDVGFSKLEKAGKFARPEVKHFIGKIRKPRDMTAPEGSLLLLDRISVSTRDGRPYLQTAWATAWVRRPEEESVLSCTASVTYLKEKDKLRDDGTKGYKGLLTIIGDETFFAADGQGRWGDAENLMKGYSATLASDLDHAKQTAIEMIKNNINVGVRIAVDDDRGSLCIYNKFNQTPEQVVEEFFNFIEDDVAARIGNDAVLELIPVLSLPIGNDTAASLYTGMKDDKPDNSAVAIRARFTGKLPDSEGEERNAPAFVPALILARQRHATSGTPYLSVEGLHPHFKKDPPVGISAAIMAAKTANSAYFALANEASAPAPAQRAPEPAVAQAQAAQPSRAAPAVQRDARREAAPAISPEANSDQGDDVSFGDDGFDVESLFAEEAAPSNPAPARRR